MVRLKPKNREHREHAHHHDQRGEQALAQNHERSGAAASDADGVHPKPLHGDARHAQQKPEKPDAEEDSDGAPVVKANEQRQSEVVRDDAMRDRRKAEKQWHRNAAIRMKVGTLFVLEIKMPRNRKKKNNRPASNDGDRDGEQEREPLPDRHPEEGVLDQALRKLAFDFMRLDGIVKIGNLAERGGRELARSCRSDCSDR